MREQPARVIDVNGNEIAADYRAWANAQLAEHGGSVAAVLAAHRASGYLLTKFQPVLHYFVRDRGGDQANFIQIEVWEEREFVEHALLQEDAGWGVPSADEFTRGWDSALLRVDRRELSGPRYRLNTALDMQRFTALAEQVFDDRRRIDGDRQLITTNAETGERRVITVRELTPGYDRQRWPGRRFFDDWSESSAGRAGERVCTRWTFATSDYTDPQRVRELRAIPQWAHTKKIAQLKNTHRLDVHSLYGKFVQLDKRVGMPFAWYFYGLHGNLVTSGQMQRVLEAAEQGLIVLPEHDYRVLKRWYDDQYGF
ncbi:hypothetical protein [Burkholderia sp. MSMB1498]|uniref:hypothetical protein n=1 Tax=Burkholderia sp. MSMB1498 TaxID=1637842 RepID=UPI000AFD25ED